MYLGHGDYESMGKQDIRCTLISLFCQACHCGNLVIALTWSLRPCMWLTSRAPVAQSVHPFEAAQCGVAGHDELSCIALTLLVVLQWVVC